MTLKLNGYSTAQFGKCHEVPPWQSSPVGPFDAWPTGGGGFEHFYGFIGGENNQFYPALYDGFTPGRAREVAGGGLPPDRGPHRPRHRLGAHAEGAGAGEAVLRLLRARVPPTHRTTSRWSGPTSTPGKFAGGWDAHRESTFARQKELGVVTADAELTARPAEIPAWDEMPDELKPVLERQMEVYAGFLEHTDFHVGRLIDAIESLGALDNTLVYFIIGDNGASAEGTVNGAFNEMANFNGLAAIETPEFLARDEGQAGHRRRLQPLLGGLGMGDVLAVPVDQAGRLALGRYPQRHDRPLAGRHPGQGRGPLAVHPRDRRGARRSSRRPASPSPRSSTACSSRPSRARACSTASTTPTPPSATTCSTSRWRATGASTSRGGARSPGTAPRGCPTRCLPALDDDVWELYDGNVDWTQAQRPGHQRPRSPRRRSSASG